MAIPAENAGGAPVASIIVCDSIRVSLGYAFGLSVVVEFVEESVNLSFLQIVRGRKA